MAGIEITDEMTVEQLEAMTGGEQLKAEVCHSFQTQSSFISHVCECVDVIAIDSDCSNVSIVECWKCAYAVI